MLKSLMNSFAILILLNLTSNIFAAGTAKYGERCDDTQAETGCAPGFECLRIMRNEPVCYKPCSNTNDCSDYTGPGLKMCVPDPMQAFNIQNKGACVIVCKGSMPPCQGGVCNGQCPGIMQCKPVTRPIEVFGTRPWRCQ